MNRLRSYVRKHGLLKVVRYFGYPVTLLFFAPIRFLQALWASRVFAEGKWSCYLGFDVRRSINALYYWNDALNINRFGRRGISPYKGLGDADMSKLFKYSLPSLYAYWCYGAVLPLISMTGWWLMHLFWINTTDVVWFSVVILLGFFSISSFAATFVNQNYNALGWMFFPLGVWASLHDQYGIAVVAWLCASFGSITVVAVACILMSALSIEIKSVLPIVSLAPAVVKIFTHFLWSGKSNSSVLSSIIHRAKAIGLTRKGVKYQYAYKINEQFVYYLILYIVFLVSWIGVTDEIPLMWLAAVLLYVTNSVVSRFLDDQSVFIGMLGISTAMMLETSEPLLLLPYWLVISPLPHYLGNMPKGTYDIPPKIEPFDIKPIIDSVIEFLQDVKKDQRVLMAFSSPAGVYSNIFDGYREILEIPLYVATSREIHFFPDWWSVFDTNYDGAPEFWGREVSEVSHNVLKWDCDFVVVYQESGTDLENKWIKSGYEVKGELDWRSLEKLLRYEEPWRGVTPKWWLLKVPNNPQLLATMNTE